MACYILEGPNCIGGAHTLGYNDCSLVVCLSGNLDKSHPTKKQLDTLIDLLFDKIEKHNLPINNIRGHNEFDTVTKSCPGRNLNLDYVRNRLSIRKKVNNHRILTSSIL